MHGLRCIGAVPVVVRCIIKNAGEISCVKIYWMGGELTCQNNQFMMCGI